MSTVTSDPRPDNFDLTTPLPESAYQPRPLRPITIRTRRGSQETEVHTDSFTTAAQALLRKAGFNDVQQGWSVVVTVHGVDVERSALDAEVRRLHPGARLGVHDYRNVFAQALRNLYGAPARKVA